MCVTMHLCTSTALRHCIPFMCIPISTRLPKHIHSSFDLCLIYFWAHPEVERQAHSKKNKICSRSLQGRAVATRSLPRVLGAKELKHALHPLRSLSSFAPRDRK